MRHSTIFDESSSPYFKIRARQYEKEKQLKSITSEHKKSE